MDYLTLSLSLLALVASIVGIYISLKIAKRQMIVGKLEEAYEAISELSYYYHAFLILQLNLEDSISNETFNAAQKMENRISYDEQVARYKEHIDFNDLNHKCGRLEVIANAYIAGPLKVRVLAFTQLFVDLISISVHGQWMKREMFYKKGFPDNDVLNKTKDSILAELIKMIQLGGEAMKQADVREYVQNTLKHELGV